MNGCVKDCPSVDSKLKFKPMNSVFAHFLKTDKAIATKLDQNNANKLLLLLLLPCKTKSRRRSQHQNSVAASAQ